MAHSVKQWQLHAVYWCVGVRARATVLSIVDIAPIALLLLNIFFSIYFNDRKKLVECS